MSECKKKINIASTLFRIFLLLTILLIISSCTIFTTLIDELTGIPRLKRNLYEQIGVTFVFTNYEDEGRIFLITNACNIDAPVVEDVPGSGNFRPVRWHDPTYRQDMDDFITSSQACMVRELTGNMPLAIEMVKKYKWIEVNGSLKSTSLAIALTASKLQKIFGQYDASLNNLRGAVLVYLPQGPRMNEMETLDQPYPNDDQLDDMWEEMHNLLCGCYPNSHPEFNSVLARLVNGAENYKDNILVWSKSYSGHQVIDVVKDKQNVFFYNVGPSFGSFNRAVEGWTTWDHVNGQDCTRWTICNSWERDDLPLNPQISDYRNNIRTSTVPQCMLSSFNDCISIFGSGSALTSYVEYDWFTRSNMCPTLLGAAALDDYLVEYVSPDDWDLTFDPPNAYQCFSYGNPTERLPLAGPSGDPCKLYGSPHTAYDIWTNLDSTHGPNSIRLVRVRGDEIDGVDPDSPINDAAHMEYFCEIPKAISEVITVSALGGHSQCTVDFPVSCPACPTADDVMDPTQPLYDQIIELRYKKGLGLDRTLPNTEPVRNDDIVYLPIYPITQAQLEEALSSVSSLDDATYPGQYHVSGEQYLDLETNTFASDDPHSNAEIVLIRLVEEVARLPAQDIHYEFFNDTLLVGEIHNRLRVDHYGVWQPSNLFSETGPHYNLSGAWIDIRPEAFIHRSLESEINHYLGDTLRVLVMKNWDGQSASYPMALPDIRNFYIPPAWENIRANHLNVPVSFEVFVPNSVSLDAVSVSPITVGDLDPDNIGSTNTGSYIASEGTGRYYTFLTRWNARDTWCIAYEDDRICGGSRDYQRLDVRFRIQARNTEGAHFFRDYALTIWDDDP